MMLNYLLAAGIGAMSSILANKNVAVYNDGFRPVYAEYFNGRMDRKSLAATSFAVSFGLIVGFGFTGVSPALMGKCADMGISLIL